MVLSTTANLLLEVATSRGYSASPISGEAEVPLSSRAHGAAAKAMFRSSAA